MSSKKEEIMAIACDALQKSGISGFSFRDLAELVGIKSSSVHYHFRSKNDLLKAIIIDFRENVSEYLSSLEQKSNNLKEALTGVVEMFEGVLEEDKFCVCGILAAEKKHLSEEVLDELKLTFTGLESWLNQMIKKYGGNKVPGESLSLLIISALEGSLLIDRVTGEKNYFKALRETLEFLT